MGPECLQLVKADITRVSKPNKENNKTHLLP